MEMDRLQQIQSFKELTQQADHIDIKSIESSRNLREFLAELFSYMPFWLKALYGIRWLFVRVLGMKQEGMPKSLKVKPEDISMTPGDMVTFFEVHAAEEDHYWIAGAKETHLSGYLGVVVEALGNGKNLFHFVTIVHYNKWTGPLYFNVIRPFHHLVVQAMINYAARVHQHGFFIRNTGIFLMLIAVIHNIFGAVIFSEQLLAIGRHGVFDSIQRHWDRGLAIWFLLFGVVFFLLGALVQWMMNRWGEVPAFMGWGMLALCVLGVVLMPDSGFYLGIPVAIAMLLTPKPKRSPALPLPQKQIV